MGYARLQSVPWRRMMWDFLVDTVNRMGVQQCAALVALVLMIGLICMRGIGSPLSLYGKFNNRPDHR